MGLFPFPPIENDWKWLYQLLPINYESKLPSDGMPGLYVILVQIQAVWGATKELEGKLSYNVSMFAV